MSYLDNARVTNDIWFQECFGMCCNCFRTVKKQLLFVKMFVVFACCVKLIAVYEYNEDMRVKMHHMCVNNIQVHSKY